jgi:hypothetical protein
MAEWPRIQNDLKHLGSAGFEANGRKYVLHGISESAESWAVRLENEISPYGKDDDNGKA